MNTITERESSMKKPLAIAVACIGFAAQAQTIQPGLWEFKHDMRMPGRPDVAAQMAQMREQMTNVALAGARNMFRMVILTRNWNANHGGIYVPVT